VIERLRATEGARQNLLGEGPELPLPEIPQALGESSGWDGRVVAAGNHRTSIV